MLFYKNNLKYYARQLRKNMTDSERILWSRLRCKQLLDVQFYRQRPIENYIVDFLAPKVKLVIEVDGSQHTETIHAYKDKRRDAHLANLGIHVLRFNNRQILQEIDEVIEVIFRKIIEQLKNPPQSPFMEGGKNKKKSPSVPLYERGENN